MTGLDRLEELQDVARLIPVPSRRDPRGALHPFDFDALPFVPQRAFVVEPAAAGTTRGGHAHRSARQILVRLAGVVTVELFHRGRSVTVRLDATEKALLLEPLVWARHTYETADALLLVLASEPFDPTAYIDDKAVLAGLSAV